MVLFLNIDPPNKHTKYSRNQWMNIPLWFCKREYSRVYVKVFTKVFAEVFAEVSAEVSTEVPTEYSRNLWLFFLNTNNH